MFKKVLSLLLISFFSFSASAYDTEKVELTGNELPKELKKSGIVEKLDTQLDLDLPFIDDEGQEVTLRKYFSKTKKPVVLSLIYYSCPNLCNFHLNGLTDGLKKLKWTIGKEFDVVSVSFDERETPTTASAKKENYLKAYARPGAEKGWHFLTGKKENIKKLADSVGFSYSWQEETKEWAHASAAIMVTPEGKVSRYLHGIHFEKQNLRLALLETSKGNIGNIIDNVVLYCFRFDPKKNKYTLYAYNIMKAGATATLFLMALFFVPVWRRERLKVKKQS